MQAMQLNHAIRPVREPVRLTKKGRMHPAIFGQEQKENKSGGNCLSLSLVGRRKQNACMSCERGGVIKGWLYALSRSSHGPAAPLLEGLSQAFPRLVPDRALHSDLIGRSGSLQANQQENGQSPSSAIGGRRDGRANRSRR